MINLISRFPHFVAFSIVCFLTVGCSDNDFQDGSVTPAVDAPPTNIISNVIPSLGLIRGGSVRITDTLGNEIPGAIGDLGDSGSVELSYASNTPGPLIVEVLGDENAEYYDESADSFLPFPAGASLRAVIPQPQESVGVTPLTEIATRRFVANGGTTAADASAVNEEVRLQFLPGITDITIPPTVVASTSDKLADDEAGLYAAYLGALANLGAGDEAPALAVTDQLAEDFTDGVFDTAVDGVSIPTPIFNNTDTGFEAKFDAAIASAVSRFGGSDLGIDDFVDVIGSLSPNPVNDNGDGTPDNSNPDTDIPDTDIPDTDTPGDGVPDNGGVGGIADLFGEGFDPMLPTTIPNTIAPGTPIDIRGEVPALFVSWLNSVENRIRSSSLENTTGGVAELDLAKNSYTYLAVNANGVPVRSVRYQLGPDGIELSDDDIITGYDVYDVNPDNKRTGYDGVYTSVHPGSDGVWFSADDLFSEGRQLSSEVIIEGNRIFVLGTLDAQQELMSGEDGILFTDDDKLGRNRGYIVIVLNGEGNHGQVVVFGGNTVTGDEDILSYSLANFDGSQHAVQTITYTGDGSDNNWFTPDDDVAIIVVGIINSANDRLDYLLNYTQEGSDGAFFTQDDVLTSITEFDYNTDGSVKYRATHSQIGEDGVFFTADDTGSAIAFKYDVNGIETTFVVSNAIGADAIWFTGDDLISAFRTTEKNAAGQLTLDSTFVDPGVDGLWFTGDDIVNGGLRSTYDASGNLTQNIRYGAGVGDDGLSLTADDVAFYQLFLFDGAGSQLSALFIQPGEDGIAFTSDDTTNGTVAILDASGTNIKTQRVTGPGADAIWFTADDVVAALTNRIFVDGELVGTDTFSEAGTDGVFGTADDVQTAARKINTTSDSVTSINFDGAGTDEIWGTEDDQVSTYSVDMLDSAGNIIMSVFYPAAGEDGIFFTDDDSIDGYTIIEYDTAGNRTLAVFSSDPGPDGIFLTSDDLFGAYERLGYDGNGVIVSRKRFQDAGPDGLFFTDDDVLTAAAFISLDTAFLASTAANSGFLGASCPIDQTNSGSLTMLVQNAFGSPIPGAIVQIDAAGTTQLTDADGKTTFTALSGSHDFHVFSNDHSWESFLCLAPEGDVTITANLNEKIPSQSGGRREDTAENSAVFISNRDISTLYALIDSSGKVLGTNVLPSDVGPYDDGSTAEWANIAIFEQRLTGHISLFDTEIGSDVTAELWAYRYDFGSLQDGLVEVVMIAPSTTYKTTSFQDQTNVVDVTFTFSETVLADLETLYTATNAIVLRLGNGLASNTAFLESKRKLQRPEGLPVELTFVDSIDFGNFGESGLTITAIPGSGLTDSFRARSSKILRAPIIRDQNTPSLPNPSYTWLPAAQNIEGNWLSVQNLILDGFDKNLEWVIHLPAGVGEVNFPGIPSAISGDLFVDGSYTIDLKVFSSGGLNYSDAIIEGNLSKVPMGVDYDEFKAPRQQFAR